MFTCDDLINQPRWTTNWDSFPMFRRIPIRTKDNEIRAWYATAFPNTKLNILFYFGIRLALFSYLLEQTVVGLWYNQRSLVIFQTVSLLHLIVMQKWIENYKCRFGTILWFSWDLVAYFENSLAFSIWNFVPWFLFLVYCTTYFIHGNYIREGPVLTAPTISDRNEETFTYSFKTFERAPLLDHKILYEGYHIHINRLCSLSTFRMLVRQLPQKLGGGGKAGLLYCVLSFLYGSNSTPFALLKRPISVYYRSVVRTEPGFVLPLLIFSEALQLEKSKIKKPSTSKLAIYKANKLRMANSQMDSSSVQIFAGNLNTTRNFQHLENLTQKKMQIQEEKYVFMPREKFLILVMKNSDLECVLPEAQEYIDLLKKAIRSTKKLIFESDYRSSPFYAFLS